MEFRKLSEKVPRGAFEVLTRIISVDPQASRRRRHQLTKPIGAFWADSRRVVVALSFDQRLEEDMPIGGRQSNKCKTAVCFVSFRRRANSREDCAIGFRTATLLYSLCTIGIARAAIPTTPYGQHETLAATNCGSSESAAQIRK